MDLLVIELIRCSYVDNLRNLNHFFSMLFTTIETVQEDYLAIEKRVDASLASVGSSGEYSHLK